MQCPRCGAAAVASDRFCVACGQALDRPINGANAGPLLTSAAGGDVAAAIAAHGRAAVKAQWRRWWWKILLIGIALYAVVSNVTLANDNILLLPNLFMIGTFLVPIAYVAYLYEDGTLYDVPLSRIALLFFFGGVIGTVVASLLLSRLLVDGGQGLFGSQTLWNALLIGFAEEAAKLVVLLPFLAITRKRYGTVMHGIVLGAAAGMGFAAFESMGYAFLALVLPGGGIDAMAEVIRLRALLAPLGHGTWTAIIAAAIWRERIAGRLTFGVNVLVAYVVAALLHTLWDYLPPLGLPFANVPLMPLLIGAISLLVLRFFLHVARGRAGGAYGEQNLARALPIYFGELRDAARRRIRRS